MTEDIVELPDNLIGLEDQRKIESFGGHEIAHGRASRFSWARDDEGNPLFNVYRGGPDEKLVLSIGRHRKEDEFYAQDPSCNLLTSGTLDHVMAALDKKLSYEHGESSPL